MAEEQDITVVLTPQQAANLIQLAAIGSQAALSGLAPGQHKERAAAALAATAAIGRLEEQVQASEVSNGDND